MESQLLLCLDGFWKWAGMDGEAYARMRNNGGDITPFYYPRFVELRNLCKGILERRATQGELDVFLTCMALDEEEEILLDWCKDCENVPVLERLVVAGCQHLQPDARWQIAELLRCRDIPGRDEFLERLCGDENPYVRKRAKNALAYLDASN